ncbi:mannan endo-1,4-beta-mannosidase [Clostridia bacterium]|nr:mannan endo-1,4-beta-mannosidase [Clostridia bacterium]
MKFLKYAAAVLTIALSVGLFGCSAKEDGAENPTETVTEVITVTEAPAEAAAVAETTAATETPDTTKSVKFSLHERLPRPTEQVIETDGEDEELPPAITYEAKDANIYGSITVADDGGAGRFEQKNPEDKLEFVINVEKEGFYRLDFEALSLGGHKENNFFLDGVPAGTFINEGKDYEIAPIQHVYMEVGEHTAAITANWGWIVIKNLTVVPEVKESGSLYNVPIKLVNPNADDGALALMSFLAMNYGKTSLAGQQSQGNWSNDHGLFGGESKGIYEKTGKYPAVIGLDMINYSLSRVAKGAGSSETAVAIQAWENNAIVTFCWHWNAPTPYLTGEWSRGFYTENTVKGFFKEIMSGKDKAGYQLLLDDIDAIAVQLRRLNDAGVPILWRPLHEASGGWFWWGTDKDSYLELYKLMFDRLNNYHGLTNLIWVWNGQSADWYPGDEYVDIIGEDIYPGERVYASQVNKFLEAAAYTTAPKMITLSENGCLFDPDLAKRDGAMWSFWCVWNGEFANTEKFTDFDMLKKVYDSEYVTTLDELPDLKTYPIYTEGDAD